MSTHRQTGNPIFYKVETYLDHLLVPEIYVIPNFAKIVRKFLEIYESCVHGQTDKDNPIFYQVETYLDHFLVFEIHLISNFVKIVWVVLLIYEICVQGPNDRQTENPIFYKVETYLDRLLVLKIYIIANFVKIVSSVLEIVNIFIPIYIYLYTILAPLINKWELWNNLKFLDFYIFYNYIF